MHLVRTKIVIASEAKQSSRTEVAHVLWIAVASLLATTVPSERIALLTPT
jgi:hypothetical protein